MQVGTSSSGKYSPITTVRSSKKQDSQGITPVWSFALAPFLRFKPFPHGRLNAYKNVCSGEGCPSLPASLVYVWRVSKGDIFFKNYFAEIS